MQLSKKKNEEKIIAQIFLDLYNPIMGTQFEIQELDEPDDVICLDTLKGKQLKLQITLLIILEDDIAYMRGHRHKPISPTTHTHAVTLDDAVGQLSRQLDDKLLSNYGPNTALVFSQVSILWEPKEFKVVAPKLRNGVLHGKEHHYGAGVWIICTDNSVSPTGNALFCLSEPIE